MAWITQIFILYIFVATSHGHVFFGNHHDISDLPDIISKVVNHNLQHSLFRRRGYTGNGDISSGGNYGNSRGPNNIGLSYIRPGSLFSSQELMDQRSNLGSQESGELIQNPSNFQIPINSPDLDNTYVNVPTVDSPKQIISGDLEVNQTKPNIEISEKNDEQNIPGIINEQNIDVVSQKLNDGVGDGRKDLRGIVEHIDAPGLTKKFNSSDVNIDTPERDSESADIIKPARKENKLDNGLKTNIVVDTIDNKLQNNTSVGINKNRNENSIVFPDKVDAVKVSEVEEKDANGSVNANQFPKVSSRNSNNDNNPILYAVKIVPALVSKTKPKSNKNFPVLTSNNEATTNDQSNGSPVQYVVQNPPNGYNYVPSNTGNNYPGQVYMSNNPPPSSGSQTNGYYQVPNSGQQYYTVQLSNGQSALVPVSNGQTYVPSNIQNSPQGQFLVSGNGQQYVPNNGNNPMYVSGNGQQYVSNSGQPIPGNNQQYVLNNGQQYVSSSGQPVQDNGQQYVMINGQQYVASNNQPVQGNGPQYVLSNGQQYLPSSGQAVPGNGPQYVLNNGQQYVPITQGNGQTYVPNNGQQYVTSNGQILVSGNGQQYVPSNGQVGQSNGQVLVPDNSQQYVQPIQSSGQQYVSSNAQNIAPSGYVSWPYNSDQNTVQNNGQVYVPVNGQIQSPQSNIITVPSGSLVTIGDNVPLLVLKDKDEHSATASTSSEESSHEDDKKSGNEDEDKLKKF